MGVGLAVLKSDWSSYGLAGLRIFPQYFEKTCFEIFQNFRKCLTAVQSSTDACISQDVVEQLHPA